MALPRTEYTGVKSSGLHDLPATVVFEVKALSHDFDRIRDEICRVLTQSIRIKGADARVVPIPHSDQLYVYIYGLRSPRPLGLYRIKEKLK